MSRSKRTFITGISILLVCIVISGCLPNKQGGFTCVCAPLIKKVQTMIPNLKNAKSPATPSTATSTSQTRPHPPVRTGTITTGAKVQVASQSIDSTGGMVVVNKPGDPLDGFVINVPAKSYSNGRTFKVSSALITNQSFGDDINPISPLITVDNGGEYAGNLMYVRVPVKVPEGNFAMGFIYDEKSKQLEGMPLVAMDADSITVATRHFTGFFISMIEKALLKKDIDSGFRPGMDDWQFTNYGSFISRGGHCEGQSLSAMWYYCTQPDGKDMCLYGRYDNNGNKPSTPDLWQDDSLGYRFCSRVHEDFALTFSDEFWFNLSGKALKLVNNTWEIVDAPGLSDETRYNMFAYSIRATNEPQFVRIRGQGAHTMVVYKIVGNALYVADPNYPGNTDRKIIFYSGEGKFKPYQSGANRTEIEKGNSVAYNNIEYYAKSTLVTWTRIAPRWTEFKAGTIGNDKFPPYEVVVNEGADKKTPLDGYKTNQKKIKISTKFSNVYFRESLYVFREGKQLSSFEGEGEIELNPGENNLGIMIAGYYSGDWYYIDFKYYTVEFEDGDCKTPPPANLLAKLQKTTRFVAELLNLPTNIEGHGSMNRWVPGFKFTKHFYVPGNAVSLGGDGTMPITWSGTSFSGGGSAEYPDKLTGSVCYGGGKLLVSFDYATNNPVDNLVLSVKNLPVDTRYFLDPKYAIDGKSQLQYANTDASEVKKYVTRLEWKSHEERPVHGGPPAVWDASLISADWSNKCGFLVTFKE